jgi:hypothetical protein
MMTETREPSRLHHGSSGVRSTRGGTGVGRGPGSTRHTQCQFIGRGCDEIHPGSSPFGWEKEEEANQYELYPRGHQRSGQGKQRDGEWRRDKEA